MQVLNPVSGVFLTSGLMFCSHCCRASAGAFAVNTLNIVHSYMKILSLFTHHHVFTNTYMYVCVYVSSEISHFLKEIDRLLLLSKDSLH